MCLVHSRVWARQTDHGPPPFGRGHAKDPCDEMGESVRCGMAGDTPRPGRDIAGDLVRVTSLRLGVGG